MPERWWTRNQLHYRVPALNWDDFGAHSNKAVTQYDEAWDHFKGGFDVLGTKIGVLIATMVDPLEPTFQIQNKYTHEIEILSKGEYKYDQVKWKQDYKGWKPKLKKRFIEHNTFEIIPNKPNPPNYLLQILFQRQKVHPVFFIHYYEEIGILLIGITSNDLDKSK